mgnify:CR=1 FL=1
MTSNEVKAIHGDIAFINSMLSREGLKSRLKLAKYFESHQLVIGTESQLAIGSYDRVLVRSGVGGISFEELKSSLVTVRALVECEHVHKNR